MLTDDTSKVDCRECREVLNSNSPIDTHYVKPWYEKESAGTEAFGAPVMPGQDSVDVHASPFELGPPPASATQVGGDHYTVLDVQPWDAMANWMSACEFEGFLRGNAIKYLARAGSKGDALEDFKKARHYLDKLIEVLDGAGGGE
jgi:hypothetical protein